MKDFEVKIGKYKGKQASEVMNLNPKYFKWLYNRLWDKRRREEYCFCMEEIWTTAGLRLKELTENPKPTRFSNKNLKNIKSEPRRFFYHLSDNFLPESVPLSQVTQEMRDAEDNWVAEHHEMIIEQK